MMPKNKKSYEVRYYEKMHVCPKLCFLVTKHTDYEYALEAYNRALADDREKIISVELVEIREKILKNEKR